MSQITPSAHVNLFELIKRPVQLGGKANQIGQQWAVTVACRNAQSQMTDGRAADEAGL